MGERNQFEVADKPVWIEVAIVSFCFMFFGTNEETYLAIYAAGVFVLLSMTGWAVTKRLARELKSGFTFGKVALIAGTSIAALLTTGATFSIFEERFLEGAWTYFIFIPILYAIFTYFRNRMGDPTPEMDYLGQVTAAQLAGFGFGQSIQEEGNGNGSKAKVDLIWEPEPIEKSRWREQRVEIKRIAVLLDGSDYAAQAIPMAKVLCETLNAHLTLLSHYKDDQEEDDFQRYRQSLKNIYAV